MLFKSFFIVSLSAVCLLAGTSDSHGTSLPSKQDVIDGVIAARTSISDIEVAFRFEATKSPTGTLVFDNRMVRVKGDRFFMERQYGFGGEKQFSTACSYDGVSAVGYQGVNQMGYTTSNPDIEIIETDGSGFFDLLLWYPSSITRTQTHHHRDLVSILESPWSSLRAEVEFVGDSPCLVLDVLPPGAPHPVATLWLDISRGYVPLIQRHFGVNDADAPRLELEIETVVQVSDSLWLPTRGWRRTFAGTGMTSAYLLQVEEDESGWQIAVNTGFSDDDMDFSQHMPAGSTLVDLDSGVQWIVGSEDYTGMAETAVASLGLDSRPSVGRSRLSAPVSTAWAGLMAVGLLAGVLVARSHTSRAGHGGLLR